jgi:exonuclease 3'-5' domain-containing protein 1
LLNIIAALPKDDQVLFIDFEGINLSRSGVLCCGQLMYPGSSTIYILDNITYPQVFTLAIEKSIGTQPFSLQGCFESEDFRKVLFDPRQDSDAIYAQHGVHMRNVICLKLSDVANDRCYKKAKRPFVHGLAKVLEQVLPTAQRQYAKQVKEKGLKMCATEHGGSYEVFRERLLDRHMVEYMCMDIVHLEHLYKERFLTLPPSYQAWVMKHSSKSIDVCLRATGLSKGPHLARAPPAY